MRIAAWSAGVLVLAMGVLLLAPVSGGNRCMQTWRVTLDTPGGPLPFGLSYKEGGEDGSVHVGSIERIRVDVELNDDGITVEFPHYDSTLALHRDSEDTLVGTWSKARGDSVAELRASAIQGPLDNMFDGYVHTDPPADFEGRWRVDFDSSDDDAIGVFTTTDLSDGRYVSGTFLTTTGDYRWLWGRVDDRLMRLSTFDGAHAFLFHARMQDDGTIRGDFWSGNWWHETWTATRDDDIELPDMFAQTTLEDESALGDLVFTNLRGDPTRVVDALDATNAPARVIEVFGTWCPNCSDAAKELASLKETYGDQLGIVGLAFELTDDHERSAQQVKHYTERHGVSWDVLVAGISNKDAATEELKILDQVRSYPTTIFLNSDNEVVEIHQGFAGPATGDAYKDQNARYTQIIESLINGEPSP